MFRVFPAGLPISVITAAWWFFAVSGLATLAAVQAAHPRIVCPVYGAALNKAGVEKQFRQIDQVTDPDNSGKAEVRRLFSEALQTGEAAKRSREDLANYERLLQQLPKCLREVKAELDRPSRIASARPATGLDVVRWDERLRKLGAELEEATKRQAAQASRRMVAQNENPACIDRLRVQLAILEEELAAVVSLGEHPQLVTAHRIGPETERHATINEI